MCASRGVYHSWAKDESTSHRWPLDSHKSQSGFCSPLASSSPHWPQPHQHSPCEAAPHSPADQPPPQLPDPGIRLLFICCNPGNVSQGRDGGHISQTQIRDVGQGLWASKIHQHTCTDPKKPLDSAKYTAGGTSSSTLARKAS